MAGVSAYDKPDQCVNDVETGGEKKVTKFLSNLTQSLTASNRLKQPFIYTFTTNDNSPLELLDGFLSGIAASAHIPSRYVLLTGIKYLSNSGVIATRDATTGANGPPGGYNFNLLNIKENIKNLLDPRVPLSPGAVAIGQGATKLFNNVRKVAGSVTDVIDTVRLDDTTKKNSKKVYSEGRKTAQRDTSTASSWADVGGNIGALVGGVVGTMFGGFLAYNRGASAGKKIGTAIGGLTDRTGARKVAELIANKFRNVHGVIDITKEGHIVLNSSFTPMTEDHRNEWLEMLHTVVCTVLNKRQMCLVTYQPAEEIFGEETCDSLTPQNVMSEFDLFVSEGSMTSPLIRDACDTLQFFSSFLVFANSDFVLSDLEKLIGSTDDKIPEIKGEYVCMNSNGSTLYWFNPLHGAGKAVIPLPDKQLKLSHVKSKL